MENNIQTTALRMPLYGYQCLDCREYFICPAWQPARDYGGIDSKIAACPHCKSSEINALDAALSLLFG